MDRLEHIRQIIDKEIAKLQNEDERKFAYIHTYGVSQMATLLAYADSLNTELASIAAMLHDLAIYVTNCPHHEHAARSAALAESILKGTKLFEDEEIRLIVHAIMVHSEKMKRDNHPFAEMLKDSDVLQHYLYNTNIPLDPKEQFRLFYILEKLEKIRTQKQQEK